MDKNLFRNMVILELMFNPMISFTECSTTCLSMFFDKFFFAVIWHIFFFLHIPGARYE